MFIAFEGIDGSGKSTISSRLAGYLKGKGMELLLTSEPQDESLRHPSQEDAMNGFLMFYRFMADRISHLRTLENSIAEGKIVISDRYMLSTIAYQGPLLEKFFGSYEETMRWMNEASRPVTLLPDVTFLLDAPPALALKRISGKAREAFEREDYLTKVRDYYLRARWPNMVIMDAGLSIEECMTVVIETLEKLLG